MKPWATVLTVEGYTFKAKVNFAFIFVGCPLTPTLSKSFVSGLVEHFQNALLSVLE